MTEWILFTAPLIIASLVLLLGFVGCGLNSEGLGVGTIPSYEETIGNHPNLISFWRLGERSGTTATDSADGNNGEYTGGVTLAQPGLVKDNDDTAAQFDGTSGYVAVPHNDNLNPPAFTVEALVNIPAGDGEFHAVVSSRDLGPAGEPFGYILYAGASPVAGDPDVWQAWVGTGTGVAWTVLAGPALTPGTHYLAMTYDKTTLKLYVDPTDDTPAMSDTTYVPNTTTELRIGAGANEIAPLYFWSGVIDEVAIYDAALDFPTIREHAQLALTGASEG